MIVLPFPPSANRYWRSAARGGRAMVYKSAEAKAYAAAVDALDIEHVALVGPVSVEASFYFPSLRGDLDNRIKVLLDVLQGIAYADDRQVHALCAVRRLDRENPRVEVMASEFIPLTED